MRLLETSSLRCHNVDEENLEARGDQYAILSHRWRQEEVSFQDLTQCYARNKKGYGKIQDACRVALSRGYKYLWVDTCCINKEVDSELTEAITSMWRWYANASLCIAYLDDVSQTEHTTLAQSEWFQRGWTLQELIAPKGVEFYDQEWRSIGTKSDLVAQLSDITDIPRDVLRDRSKIRSCSVAQRMSWAAKRKTTRIEDLAYSLIGLFEVQMIKNYGEQENAFFRLQTAIIAKFSDQTIFAWTMDPDESYTGLLAHSPSQFEGCEDVTSVSGSGPFTLNNLGLSLSLPLLPYCMDTYVAYLHAAEDDCQTGILLRRLSGAGRYVRVKDSAGWSTLRSHEKYYNHEGAPVCVQRQPIQPPPNLEYGFRVRKIEMPSVTPSSTKTLSRDSSAAQGYLMIPNGFQGTAGIFYNNSSSQGWAKVRWVFFGFDDHFNPMCMLANAKGYPLGSQEQMSYLFRRADASSAQLRAVNAIFSNSWIKGQTGTVPSPERGWPTGKLILKGSRESGLHCNLPSLNIRISITLCANPQSDVRTKIWTVDVTNLGGPSPEREHIRHKGGNCVRTCIAYFLALLGCGCYLQELVD